MTDGVRDREREDDAVAVPTDAAAGAPRSAGSGRLDVLASGELNGLGVDRFWCRCLGGEPFLGDRDGDGLCAEKPSCGEPNGGECVGGALKK